VKHRWLRLVFDGDAGELAWESAEALEQWERLDAVELEPGFDLDTANISLGVVTWNGPFSAEPLTTFGHAFVCDAWAGEG
jgi:hypothetical protein